VRPFAEREGRRALRWGVATCLLAVACTGSFGTGPDRPGGVSQDPSLPSGAASGPAGAGPGLETGALGAGAGSASGTVLARCVTKAVGETPLQRLTHVHYDYAVRDLLGDSTQPAREFAKGTEQGLFDTMADQQVAPLLADQYLDAAVSLAEGVKDIKALLGCDPAGTNAASCVREFVKRFARRAFRRPLSTPELDALIALYDKTRAASDPATGVRAVLAAVLVSPNFLFRPEFGAQAAGFSAAKKLTPYEQSARLAALLWASLPDDTLLDAAAAGQLETRTQLEAQARRMLNDPKARAGMAEFYAQWFGLPLLDTATKDKAVYPGFDDALRAAMGEESRRFIDDVLWSGDARLATFLTAPYAFVNGALAKLYGVSAPKDPAAFVKVALDPATRSGILTQASMLSTFASSNASSPVKRGKWLRTRLLCHDLPEPPANVPPLPPPEQGVSTRERFAMHTANAACSGCHRLIDGLGFGLEAYDGVGAYRTRDLGVAVDAHGEITATLDIDGPYEGARELAERLADSEQVRACAPRQWFRYTFGRREAADDACALEALESAFAQSDGDLKQLMIALVASDAFTTYRNPN
jgi:Protein of unknown function (DUF1592)/Protein of unknown function (DUF1588)/Protein of unknown function (DUF1595)/Protein of unknown function (DUF1585)/Protein of unknown function (DUF1587)